MTNWARRWVVDRLELAGWLPEADGDPTGVLAFLPKTVVHVVAVDRGLFFKDIVSVSWLTSTSQSNIPCKNKLYPWRVQQKTS